MNLFAQHVERCMENRFKSYETAYGEANQNPTDDEFREVLTNVNNVQKSESQHCAHALSNFVIQHGGMRNLSFDLTANTAYGHDRVLGKLKVWQARIHLTKPGRIEDKIDSNSRPVVFSTQYRFLIALSFPGEERPRVSKIAAMLASHLGKDQILYDEWHAAEFARPNLDIYLPKLYREQSLLIVFFFGSDYGRKEWCGLEWRAGRDLLKEGKGHRLMLLRLDSAEIEGLYSIDGYLDIRKMPDDVVTRQILKRLELTQKPSTEASEGLHRTVTQRASFETVRSNETSVTPRMVGGRYGGDRVLSDNGHDLNPKETELLWNAVKDSKGQILHTQTFDGESIRTNQLQFLENADARIAAEWIGAFRSLQARGFIEPLSYDSDFFQVTGDGYRAADELEGFARWDAKSIVLRARYVNARDNKAITLTCKGIIAIPPRYFPDQVGADRSVQRSLKEPRTLLVEGIDSEPALTWTPTEVEFLDVGTGKVVSFLVEGMEFVRPSSLRIPLVGQH